MGKGADHLYSSSLSVGGGGEAGGSAGVADGDAMLTVLGWRSIGGGTTTWPESMSTSMKVKTKSTPRV